jgi:hypothetical protein
MKITSEIEKGLNLAFNESKLNYVDITPDFIEVVLDCICMNENNEFPDDSRIKIQFKPYGKIAISYRKGEWDDKQAEIVKIESDKLKDYFSDLTLDSMYGWEFINFGEKEYEKWSDKLSLILETDLDSKGMNTIDLFAEQIAKDAVTINIRIWFDDFKIFDSKENELTKQQFIDSGQRGWNQLYDTGIQSQDHKNFKMKK